MVDKFQSNLEIFYQCNKLYKEEKEGNAKCIVKNKCDLHIQLQLKIFLQKKAHYIKMFKFPSKHAPL